MRIQYLPAIAIALLAGTGLATHSVGSLPLQSTPAMQVAGRLAASVDAFLLGSGG